MHATKADTLGLNLEKEGNLRESKKIILSSVAATEPQDIVQGSPEGLVNYKPGFYLSSLTKEIQNHATGSDCNIFHHLHTVLSEPADSSQHVDAEAMRQQGQIADPLLQHSIIAGYTDFFPAR